MVLGTRRRKTEKLFEEIEALSRDNRERRDPDIESRILRLRHQAGIWLLDNADDAFTVTDPGSPVPIGESGLPEAAPGDFDAAALRAAILDGGCLLVRGLADRDEAAGLASGIDGALEAREQGSDNGPPRGFYEEFEPDPRFEAPNRPWIAETGGVLVGDSPKLMVDTLDLFERTGLRQVIADYLGERPAVSLQKSTLRKASPDTPGAWHQDGRFLGEVSAMNVWLSLSRCGEEAPGLDLVPHHIDHFVATGTEGTFLDTQVSDTVAEEAAGEAGILSPVFEPGDALLFDEMFLHKTGSDPSMPKTRHAIETWFFGPSRWPGRYAPFAA